MSEQDRTEDGRRKFLWAPWRIEYILNEKETGCLFCRKAESQDDAKNYVIYRRPYTFALLNTFPYNNGHLLVAPYRHLAGLESLMPEEMTDLMENVRICLKAVKKVMLPDGFNVGFNLGKSAGAGVVDHLHLHIVPRWEGDTNYMPVLADTRVVSQSLTSVYKLLKGVLEGEPLDRGMAKGIL